MANCLNHQCSESEYQAINIKKKHKYIGPKDKEDGCLKHGKTAEDNVEAALKNKVNVKEKEDCPGSCECYPDLSTVQFSKWATADTNLEWKDDETVQGCKFEVTITYDRQYRDKSSKCILKPPKSPK